MSTPTQTEVAAKNHRRAVCFVWCLLIGATTVSLIGPAVSSGHACAGSRVATDRTQSLESSGQDGSLATFTKPQLEFQS
jgi:hypothetical protein